MFADPAEDRNTFLTSQDVKRILDRFSEGFRVFGGVGHQRARNIDRR